MNSFIQALWDNYHDRESLLATLEQKFGYDPDLIMENEWSLLDGIIDLIKKVKLIYDSYSKLPLREEDSLEEEAQYWLAFDILNGISVINFLLCKWEDKEKKLRRELHALEKEEEKTKALFQSIKSAKEVEMRKAEWCQLLKQIREGMKEVDKNLDGVEKLYQKAKKSKDGQKEVRALNIYDSLDGGALTLYGYVEAGKVILSDGKKLKRITDGFMQEASSFDREILSLGYHTYMVKHVRQKYNRLFIIAQDIEWRSLKYAALYLEQQLDDS